jgi:hypothetical protein
MAAAGDRCDDDAGVLLLALPEPAKRPVARRTPQRTNNSLTGARIDPARFPLYENPIVEPARLIESAPYDIGVGKFQETMNRFPAEWVPGMSPFIQDDCEIAAEFGVNSMNNNVNLALGYVNGNQLNMGKITHGYCVRSDLDEGLIVLEKLHPMVYRLTLDRKNLVDGEEEPFSGVLLEVGFHSRKIDRSKSTYLGKIKVFFPKNHEKMVLYVDLSKIK